MAKNDSIRQQSTSVFLFFIDLKNPLFFCISELKKLGHLSYKTTQLLLVDVLLGYRIHAVTVVFFDKIHSILWSVNP